MASGGQPTQQYVTSKNETSNLPAYAEPYFHDIMSSAQGIASRPYTPYEGQRIADFTPAQQQVQSETMGLQTPGQFQAGSQMAGLAGLGSLAASQYTPNEFSAAMVNPMMQDTPRMRAAQSSYQPNLNYFQMQGPQSFTQQGTAQQYMSPYMQDVVDVQKQQAIRDAQQGQLAANLGAVRQGTYGGARQLLASTERERNLGNQLANIQAQGQQQAFQNAQQQFNAEQAAQQQAAQQNLQAALGVQGLGAQYGTQMALANLSNAQQARVQNQAAQLQQQGLNQQQALQAALANQQQYMAAQQQTEQSRQFAAQNALAGYGQAGQMAQTLGNLGQYQQQADISRLGAQQAIGTEQQKQQQSILDQQYADFLRQRDWQLENLGYYSNLMRGIPVGTNTTSTTYAPPPSLAAQVLGTGLGGLSMYNMATKG